MSLPNLLGLLPRSCQVCPSTDHLLCCSGCRTTFYCGRDHQKLDRDSHKMGCVAVKKARTRLEREEQSLRHAPEDLLMPLNVFENGVGHFWGITGTRPYMRARFGLVDAMLHHFGSVGGRVTVVQAALDHLLDMLRLCRSDNMGIRDMIPALYIRLGRDQAAYDFMKWYATTGRDPRYDWGDIDLPFLDVKNADVLESPAEMWTDKWLDLSHSSAVVLVKVRVLLHLQAVQNALCQDVIRRRLVGTIVESRPEVLRADMGEMALLVEKMKGQVKQLCVAIDKYNPHFWPSMLSNPAAAIAVKPVAYSLGTEEEACLSLGCNFAAWAETPGAIDMIRTLRQVV